MKLRIFLVALATTSFSALAWFGALNWWFSDTEAPSYGTPLVIVAGLLVVTGVVLGVRFGNLLLTGLAAFVPIGLLGALSIANSDPLGIIGAGVWLLLVAAIVLISLLATYVVTYKKPQNTK